MKLFMGVSFWIPPAPVEFGHIPIHIGLPVPDGPICEKKAYNSKTVADINFAKEYIIKVLSHDKNFDTNFKVIAQAVFEI